jgi:hypothetical protein
MTMNRDITEYNKRAYSVHLITRQAIEELSNKLDTQLVATEEQE